jgi:hypothetical protein
MVFGQVQGKQTLPTERSRLPRAPEKAISTRRTAPSDAITGASRTSDFVSALVNRELALARQMENAVMPQANS